MVQQIEKQATLDHGVHVHLSLLFLVLQLQHDRSPFCLTLVVCHCNVYIKTPLQCTLLRDCTCINSGSAINYLQAVNTRFPWVLLSSHPPRAQFRHQHITFPLLNPLNISLQKISNAESVYHLHLN